MQLQENREVQGTKQLAERDVSTNIRKGDHVEIRVNGRVIQDFRVYEDMYLDRVKLMDIRNDQGFKFGIGFLMGRKKLF